MATYFIEEREETHSDCCSSASVFCNCILTSWNWKNLKRIRKPINYSWHTTTGYFILSYIRRTMKIWLVESIHQHTLACEIDIVWHVEFKVYRVFQRWSRTYKRDKKWRKNTLLWYCQLVGNWRDLLKKISKRLSTLVTQLKRLWKYLTVAKP